MVTVPVVRSPLRPWAAADTLTARVSGAPKSPAKASVRMARSAPSAAPDSAEMDRPGMSVTSSKLAAVTSCTKVVPCSRTLVVALFRLASVSGAGLVPAIEAP